MTDARSHSPGNRRLTLKPNGVVSILGLMVLFGLFFASIGPFDTIDAPIGPRMVYWLTTMIVGGLIIKAIEFGIDRIWPIENRVVRGLAVTLAVTPLQTLVVMFAGLLIFTNGINATFYFTLLPAVWIITIVVIAILELLRMSALRAAPGKADTVESPTGMPQALARHLPAKYRSSPLIALQAEDHYVRVHTEIGSTLILMRFSDAVADAETTSKGFRLHRSWWASEAWLENVSFKRGSGQARLKGGLTAPVSRTYAKSLKEAGWS